MSTPTIQILLLLTLIVLLVDGCATGARSIAPPVTKTMTAIGHESVANSFADAWLIPEGGMNFAVAYSPAIDPSNFTWSVESKTNLVQPWRDELGSIDDHGLLNISQRGRKTLFLRLKGTPIQ